MSDPTTDVVVVGGGIAGLAAAHRLAVDAPDRSVTLLEASDRLGGKILTTMFGSRPVDEAADAFLARVPWAIDLATELCIADEMISPSTSSAFVAREGKVRRLPEGLVLGVPTALEPLSRSGLISLPGIARAGLDLVRPDDWPGGDESVGALITRRMGSEINDWLVNPLIGSINAGDTNRLSLETTAPQLASAARRSASLIRGLRAQREESSVDPDAPIFYSFPAGMGRLVDELKARLDAATNVDVRHRVAVGMLEAGELGPIVVPVSGDPISARAAVLATPSHITADLVRSSSEVSADLAAQTAYVSVAMVTMAVRRSDVDHALDGSGLLVPRPEGRIMTACSFASSKWPHWAGDSDRAVFRASAGRHGDESALDLDDDDLVEVLARELGELIGLSGDLLEWRVSRWPRSFPQYAPGHGARIDLLERELRRDLPGVELAGAGYRGLGVPACVRQGEEAAGRVLSRLGS